MSGCTHPEHLDSGRIWGDRERLLNWSVTRQWEVRLDRLTGQLEEVYRSGSKTLPSPAGSGESLMGLEQGDGESGIWKLDLGNWRGDWCVPELTALK